MPPVLTAGAALVLVGTTILIVCSNVCSMLASFKSLLVFSQLPNGDYTPKQA
jgi:hypothetical protein